MAAKGQAAKITDEDIDKQIEALQKQKLHNALQNLPVLKQEVNDLFNTIKAKADTIKSIDDTFNPPWNHKERVRFDSIIPALLAKHEDGLTEDEIFDTLKDNNLGATPALITKALKGPSFLKKVVKKGDKWFAK